MRFIFLITFAFILTLSSLAVDFTLRNNSLKSIPLIITNYMNPNLSPLSNSAVDIPVGEKVYFRHKGKKVVLLQVTEELKGKTLIVDELIKQRIKELEN